MPYQKPPTNFSGVIQANVNEKSAQLTITKDSPCKSDINKEIAETNFVVIMNINVVFLLLLLMLSAFWEDINEMGTKTILENGTVLNCLSLCADTHPYVIFIL